MNPTQKLLLALSLLGASSLSAQSVWNGGAGNWSSNAATGWNGTGVPNAVGATANINSGTGTITVDGTYTLGTLTSAATRNLGISGGGTLIFDVSSGNALFDFTNGLMSGTGNIGGFSNYSTNLQLNDNTEFRGLVTTSSSAPIFSGKISGAGQMLLRNVGDTPTGGGLRVDLRNSTNDFSGGVNIGAGAALRLNASGAAGSGTITLANTTSGGNNLDFRVDGANPTQIHANAINFGTRSSGSYTIMSLQNNTMTVTLNGVLSGTMGGSGRINLNGGTLILGGTSANTWTGQLRSDTHGTLIADKVGAINNGFSMRTSTADTTTTLLVGVSDAITGQISADGSNSGGAAAYTIKLGLKDGNSGAVSFNNASKINLINVGGIGATISGTGSIATVAAVSATSPSLQLHSGNGTGTLTITTEIGTNTGNARNIEITGTGTVNFNRAAGNTYEGTTLVSGGTLLANNTSGSATGGTGLVTVGALGKLGGDGIITGNVLFNTGADFVFSTTQRLSVSGTVSFGGFAITDVFGLDNTVADGTYTLIDGSGSISATNLSNIGLVNAYDLGAGKRAYFDLTSDNLHVVVSAIPEPSAFAALAGLGALGLVATRRRRA